MSEANKDESVAKPSGAYVVGDPSESQKQEIITVDDRPGMSIDELLKVIKGANGMPVLFVPSSDGRLAAVAVDGLQNTLPTRGDNDSWSYARNNEQDFRSWLLLLTSLVATVTYAAGLAPPGGFWAADDKANGYVAGNSVMDDKFPVRYKLFHYSNTTAFFSSLTVIGMLAKNTRIGSSFLIVLVEICFVSLGTSYITGTCISPSRATYAIVVFVLVSIYMSLHWVVFWSVSVKIRKLLDRMSR